jgi:pepF/M3 family oligoendopeptidase
MHDEGNRLPHWDVGGIFPGLDTPEFEAAFKKAVTAIDDLVAIFDEREIAQRPPAPITPDDVKIFEFILLAFDSVLRQTITLNAYIQCFVTTDSRDSKAQARLSELQGHTMRVKLLGTRLTAWIGSLDIDALVKRSSLAREHELVLRQNHIRALHLMSPEAEELAAELNLSGGTAWEKLHGDLTSQIMVDVELDGEMRSLPMSEVRNLQWHPVRETRRRGFEAEVAAWERARVPIAAALNSIKGEVNTLVRRRGWESVFDVTLFESNIDRATFDAMMACAEEAFPDFRHYLHLKAKAFGVDRLAWYDIEAPVGQSSRVWTYPAAKEFIVEQFGSFSPRLSGLAQRAFDQNWIDAEPRAGKRDGAFCMWIRQDESRVLANFKPAYDGVCTLAHELGHAYHNLNLASRTIFQRSTPMTLAETASIFCETLIQQAALKQADYDEQLFILGESLAGSCMVVVDITSRFRFERQVFERRRERELSADELCELMLQAQRETYGDGLDPTVLHPYMWAVKPHYYSSSRSYYNFPYMFGLLFGLGLFALYEEDPDLFRSRYDDLLSSTGLALAPDLAARFGFDLRSRGFWKASLDVVRKNIDRFEDLILRQASQPRN